MSIMHSTLAIAFAAFCVWLTVRIVNRRERWAKWTLATAIGVPALYVLSFGPACWITSRTNTWASAIPVLYHPLTWAMSPNTETTINRVSTWYAKIGAPKNWEWGSVWDQQAGGHVGWYWGYAGP